MTTPSGFWSTVLGTDIMSSVATTTNNSYNDSGGTFIDNYSAGYMYIGNLLIQFTTGTTVPTTASNGSGITIYFPVAFSTTPYCVLANPLSISSSASNYTVTVTGTAYDSFTVITGGHDSYVVYIAIGPK